jgi:alpha-pyrone synthase
VSAQFKKALRKEFNLKSLTTRSKKIVNATIQTLIPSQKIDLTLQQSNYEIQATLNQLQFNLRDRVVATIEAIATGTPDNMVQQSEAAKFVANLPSLKKNQSRIEQLYQNTCIETRYMAVNLLSEEEIAFCRERNTIQARMEMYRQHGIPLAEKVARSAIAKIDSQTIKDEIGLIVFVSSTGFVAPGVDAELIKRLGLRRDTARVTVNFMGCAAAMNGLRVAADYVKAYPHRKALVVCLELSSVNAVFEDNLNDIVIHSIFSDGCAAVVIGAYPEDAAKGSGKIAITEHLSHLIENTEDGIVLGIEDRGITCRLSRYLPDYIETGVGSIIESFLASQELSKEDIDLWAVHPGGTKILQKVQTSLGLTSAQIADSWAILSQYGNMLSASVLFVMERMFERLDNNSHSKSQPITGMAFSFAPGVGLEGILFQLL